MNATEAQKMACPGTQDFNQRTETKMAENSNGNGGLYFIVGGLVVIAGIAGILYSNGTIGGRGGSTTTERTTISAPAATGTPTTTTTTTQTTKP